MQQQQPPTVDSATVARNKLRNPLLSVAEDDFPFKQTAMLMPVTPATPAVLQDDPGPAAELDNFIGQSSSSPDPSSQPAALGPPQQQAPKQGYFSSILSSLPSPASSADQSSQPPQQQTPQKQGYFTSILSSLPNLSLSSITGEDTRQQQQQQQRQQGPPQGYGAGPYGSPYQGVGDFNAGPPPQQQPLQPPPTFGGHSYSSQQSVGDFNAGPLAPPPLQQQQSPQPPPTALPPSGGSGSYRLGNQRRLKYAPPPDLTSANSPKPQIAAPSLPSYSAQSNLTGPPTFFNPNSQNLTPTGSQFSSHSGSPSIPTISSPSLAAVPSPSASGFTSPAAAAISSPSASGFISPSAASILSPSAAATINPSTSGFTSPSAPSILSPSVAAIPSPASGFPSSSASSILSPSVAAIPSPASGFPSSSAPSILSPSVAAIPSPASGFPSSSAPSIISPSIAAIPSPASGFPSSSVAAIPSLASGFPSSSAPSIFSPFVAAIPSPTASGFPSVTPSSQGSSLHNSFRSSPVANNPYQQSSGFSVGASPAVPSYQLSGSNAFSSAPQTIPSRFPETATPQNTPADVFSGFNLYRQQQQHQEQINAAFSGFGLNEPPRLPGAQPTVQLEAIKEGQTDADKTFTPISAAKVTERLENLIAEQNDDTQSVKSELSAEVATITAKIPVAEREKEELSEELTEIDLNSSGNSDRNAALIAPPTQQQELQRSLESFPVPSATTFFAGPLVSNQSNPPNAPSFDSLFSSQQPVTDPFSFVQSPSVTDSANLNAASLSGPPVGNAQILNSNVYSPQPEPSRNLEQISNVELTPQTFWGQSQTQHGPSAVLNPLYGSPSQVAPTFFNPTQFSNTSHSFPPTPSNPPPSGSISNISNSPSCQLPLSSHENFNVVPEPTGSATLSPEQISVNPLTTRAPHETVPPSLENLATGLPQKKMQYHPVYHHWFYRREVETKTLWLPFSMHDSFKLEDVHNSNDISPDTKVATDGGRYDVEILRRQRSPVYWTGPVTEVRRCAWFYKGSGESRYTPYEESIAARLEEEFKQACISNNWSRRVELNNGEYIVFHSYTLQEHYLQATTPELAASWGSNSGSEDNAYLQGPSSRPRIVKRGLDEFNIDDGEPERVDHLLFLVHGIGSVCDLKFRTVEEVVDEFRSISLQLVQSHYRNSSEQGIVNRIEVLPISWHATLHSGIDKKLKVITLGSIPKLRHFTNDTLLDILFYTSPIYCETIMKTVGSEMNRLYSLFKQRNSDFSGNVYLGGHSLGSLILFDLLCHQKPPTEEEAETNGETQESEENDDAKAVGKQLPPPTLKRKLSKKVSYVMGNAGTGQPYIHYPQLAFQPRAFFALGSPIGMFVTVRGIDTLGEDFTLPTCPAFFNIFHPFDPVAYRVESLVYPEAHKYRPMLIPHHKGRKRMHLELKETMARVGADLKQRLLESVRSTWNSVYQLAIFHKQDQTLEQEIEKVVEEQMNNPPTNSMETTNDDAGVDVKIGKLNGGRRIDYVLQEAPFEYINEYIFALTSHVCYWESEDTMLMILKEIYGSMGIQTDAQLPQQTLTIERVSTPTTSSAASPSNISSPVTPYGIDPTAPISVKPVGPPPVTGFVRKS